MQQFNAMLWLSFLFFKETKKKTIWLKCLKIQDFIFSINMKEKKNIVLEFLDFIPYPQILCTLCSQRKKKKNKILVFNFIFSVNRKKHVYSYILRFKFILQQNNFLSNFALANSLKLNF
jgi:hypothetical protein